MNSDTAYFSQTAQRTLLVLEALSLSPQGEGLTDLAKKLGCPKPSLYPILKTIEAAGYIRQANPRGPYTLAPRILQLSRGFFSKTHLDLAFEEVSREAVAVIQETMQMAILDGTSVVYVAKRECNRSVRLVSEVGTQLPAHATGLGKCLLAGLPDEEVSRRLARQPLARLTPRTIVAIPDLLGELDRVRRLGYAEDWEEVTEGLCCIAAPVQNASGEVVASVSCSAPIQRATGERWSFVREQVRLAAGQISERLGFARSDSAD